MTQYFAVIDENGQIIDFCSSYNQAFQQCSNKEWSVQSWYLNF